MKQSNQRGQGSCVVCGALNPYTSRQCQCGAFLPWIKVGWGNCPTCGEAYPHFFRQCKCGTLLPWANLPEEERKRLVSSEWKEGYLTSIKGYRANFKRAPIGRWSAASGTFSNVMDVVWEFRPDGTARCQQYGPFGYPSEEEVRFLWKEESDFTIWMQEIESAEPAEDGNLEDEERYQWVKVRYDFTHVSTDCGLEIAMVEVNQDGTLSKGFSGGLWMIGDPLGYLGSVRE